MPPRGAARRRNLQPHERALVLCQQPDDCFYKDEGGKHACLTAVVGLQGHTVEEAVALRCELHYHRAQQVEDEKECLTLMLGDADGLWLSPEQPQVEVRFRIEKVSRRKDGQKFVLKVFADPERSGGALRYEYLEASTIPINVLSKRRTGERAVSRRAANSASTAGVVQRVSALQDEITELRGDVHHMAAMMAQMQQQQLQMMTMLQASAAAAPPLPAGPAAAVVAAAAGAVNGWAQRRSERDVVIGEATTTSPPAAKAGRRAGSKRRRPNSADVAVETAAISADLDQGADDADQLLDGSGDQSSRSGADGSFTADATPGDVLGAFQSMRRAAPRLGQVGHQPSMELAAAKGVEDEQFARLTSMPLEGSGGVRRGMSEAMFGLSAVPQSKRGRANTDENQTAAALVSIGNEGRT